jgi:Mn2+/Fe2+ NRAMP family transporter
VTAPAFDPYALRAEDVEEPPPTLWRALSRLGPGMVLAASIVGSGELIATTTLGAQAGYVALWVVLLSCAVKPAVQAELGRHTVATGETGLEALDHMPGPRLGVSWILWAWAATVFLSLLQVGGMYGGLAQLMTLLVPGVKPPAWALAFLVLTLALLLGGGYERVERLALVKVALFTLLTAFAAFVLTRQGEHFSWVRVAGGLRFQLPEAGFATAVAVFGITGVGATELFMYPYWCVEKGYARFVGPNDGSASRLRRARGWIRLMHADVAASMVLYTLATLAFYLLGAGVLSPLGLVPSARDMIPTLSRLYTDTLGPWVLPLFYLGATVTLYGTIFAATAAHSRLYADLCRVMGLFERSDYARRLVFRRGFTVLLTVVPVLLYLLFESPVKMVVAGGITQSVMLPITGAGALYLRHRRLPRDLAPGRLVTAGLWVATIVMAVVTLYSLAALVAGR